MVHSGDAWPRPAGDTRARKDTHMPFLLGLTLHLQFLFDRKALGRHLERYLPRGSGEQFR